LESSLELSGLSDDLWDTLPEIGAIIAYAQHISPLAQRAQLALLDPASPLSLQLRQQSADFDTAASQLKAARENTVNWKDRLTPRDTTIALEAARKFEASFLRILQPAYWRLKKTIRARYDYAQHAVEPTLVRLLEDLQAEHAANQHASELSAAFNRDFGQPDPAALTALLAGTRDTSTSLAPSAAAFRRLLLKSADAAGLVRSLAELGGDFERFKTAITQLIDTPDSLTFAALRTLLSGLRRELRALPDLLPLLTELVDAPESLRYAVRNADIRLDQFEAAIAFKTLQNIYRADIALNRFDGRLLEAYRARIDEHHRVWLKTNAVVIRNQIRRLFREHVQISGLPAAQLTEQQKLFKKTYAAGRRELEHEFGKTMRHKSIRDLAAGESGEVVRDLKPVWLMSPLSVSDTLPLDTALFDVVIFDEASQIPVEEAVPAVYRARQVIVVGDEMQLPPTNFFGGGGGSSSSDGADSDDEAVERIDVDLEADSFLAQAARNLPSTLLAWHYRSRSENLISFSNAAFYGGNLFTIPDRHLAPASRHELLVSIPEQGATNTDALLGRSISFHFIENGVYEQRRNRSEAAYIARVVRELLLRDTKHSIGIVAFSEAQQGEIESALDALADEDKNFATLLEAEINREEDDQFCGLFIKNLENVQGDERDIILLSICYGYDRDKKMLMNFGPINQRGGEKRLNVIFSRARHHMAIVSSIRYQDITNDYNDGANALRNFLRYAENLSRGDETGARGVLENLNPLSRRALAPLTERDAVITQLAEKLRAHGHLVDLNTGQSRFRCDLAIRAKDGRAYSLGLLIDTDAHYENPSLLDRYLTRPSILKAFGWRVLLVLTKDWFHEPDAVLTRIENTLRGDTTEAPELPEIPPLAPPVNPPAPPAPPSLPKPPPAPPASTGGELRRTLKYTEGDSKKFWEIIVTGKNFAVRFGRIGTPGQTQQKQFETEAEAQRSAEQLIQSKLRKGYSDEGTT
ncbi:MAG TPA: AAA domain-containing protein, partial [Rariglobus sp.]|nr:AAA domain-containing protein [Rariglobus sp.]